MNKKDLIFAGIAVAVIGVFIWLSFMGKHPPPLTARPEHADVSLVTPQETCWGCHTPESELWLHHPKKGKPPDKTTHCSKCHDFPKAANALFNSTKNTEGLLTWQSRQQN